MSNGDRCPECGGQVIYDEERGEYVCTRCGLVVGKEYYYGPVNEKPETVERRELLLKKRPRRNNIARRLRYKLMIYRRGVRIERSRPGLIVDYDKAIRQGRFINTVTSVNTEKAIAALREKGMLRHLEEIARILEEVDPAAMARTKRSKLAIAYIVHHMATQGTYPNPAATAQLFSISLTTYKRLEKIAERIYRSIYRDETLLAIKAVAATH